MKTSVLMMCIAMMGCSQNVVAVRPTNAPPPVVGDLIPILHLRQHALNVRARMVEDTTNRIVEQALAEARKAADSGMFTCDVYSGYLRDNEVRAAVILRLTAPEMTGLHVMIHTPDMYDPYIRLSW